MIAGQKSWIVCREKPRGLGHGDAEHRPVARAGGESADARRPGWGDGPAGGTSASAGGPVGARASAARALGWRGDRCGGGGGSAGAARDGARPPDGRCRWGLIGKDYG